MPQNKRKKWKTNISIPNPTKSYKDLIVSADYLQNRTQVVLGNRLSLPIDTERLACLNYLCGTQLGTLAYQVVGRGFDPQPPQDYLHPPFLAPYFRPSPPTPWAGKG